MAIATDINGPAGRARDFTGGQVDRTRLMRRARRHSAWVRIMRLAFPAIAGVSMLFYGVALYLASPPRIKNLQTDRIEISSQDLVMQNPRYEGFNKDGGKYFVTSRTATQDIRQKGPVRLETISGTLTQPDKSLTDLKATRGTFDTKKNELELFDGIDIVSQNGMRARLSKATLDTKSNTIVSREPVKVEMPTGAVTANQLEVHQKEKKVAFIDNVVTTLKPERKAGAAPQTAAQQAQARTLGLGLGASDQPVVVNSSRLDIDDQAKVATFRGNVQAVQGQAGIATDELEAHYEGQAGAAASGGQPGAGPGNPSSKLRMLISRVPVVMTNAADKATSNAAQFDLETDTAVLLGDVVLVSGTDRKAVADRADVDQRDDTVLLTGRHVHVVQGRNELKGRRLWVDRKAGRMQLTSPGGGGRIAARFYQSEQKPGAAKSKQAAPAATVQAEGGAFGMASFKTDPNAPIDIEADNLDVNDNSRQAVFRGEVNASQGEFKVRTAEMTAFYAGQAGMAALTGEPAKPKAAGEQGAQLTRIEARKGVIVTSKEGQKVVGEWADFDVKANSVVVGGSDVVLTQGQNIVRGTKLLIDLTTGESRVITHAPVASAVPAATGPSNGLPPDSAGAGPFTTTSTGRARAVIMPMQAKEAHKKARDEGKSPAEAAAAAAAAGSGGALQIDPRTPGKKAAPTGSSSWDPASAFPGTSRN